MALPQRKHIVVARGEVADVQLGPGVAQRRDDVSRGEEPLRDATLIEHLDGARVQPTRS